MILIFVVYDSQFSFVTIYKVGKCMMPAVLKICSDFKSHVVYSSLYRHKAAYQILHVLVQESTSFPTRQVVF